MSNTTEIKQQYTLGELPELVKRLITESKFVTSPDCVIRFTAVPTEDWTKQERRAVNTALCLAVGQLPQVHGYFDGTLLESQFDQSDVLIKATTMASGDEHTIYITITTNRCKDLISDMTLSWLTCFVKLHDHSCQSDSKPTQEKETIMTEETSAETPITDVLSEITRLLDDRYIGEAVRVLTKPLNCDDVEIRPGSVEFDFFNKIVSCMRSKNVQYSFSQYDAPCFVAHGTIFVTYGSTPDENHTKQPIRDGMVRVVVGVTSPNGDEILLDAYVDPVNNTGFKLTTTPEKKEETMTENTEYVKNDNALAEILAKINSAYGNPDTTVLLKPLDSEGNQITLTHHANMLVGQILGGTMRGRKAECYSAETYNFVEGDLSDRFYVTIGFNRTDLENMDCLNLPKGGVPVVAKYASSYNPQDCVPIVFEGFVDPISGVGYQKVNKKQESQSATASLQELDKKFKEVVMYASEKGFYGTFCVSCAKHGYSQQSQSQAGRMPKSKALWNTLTDMIASLLSLVNDLDGTADIRISTAMTGGEVGIRNQVFSVSNTMPATVTVQQPAFTPNFYNGFHPQNHMPHNQCQPGYMGGVSSAFQPQSGPTVKGFKSQPNS